MTQQNLSPREAEVLTLVASGRSTKEISAELEIAESTVNWHVGNLLTKLSASSRAEAVAVALRSEALDPAAPPVPHPAEKPSLVRAVDAVVARLSSESRPREEARSRRRRARRPPLSAGSLLPHP